MNTNKQTNKQTNHLIVFLERTNSCCRYPTLVQTITLNLSNCSFRILQHRFFRKLDYNSRLIPSWYSCYWIVGNFLLDSELISADFLNFNVLLNDNNLVKVKFMWQNFIPPTMVPAFLNF